MQMGSRYSAAVFFFGAVFWSRCLLSSSDLPESGMTPCKDHAAQQVLDVLRQHLVARGKLDGVASSEAAKVGFGWCSLNCGWLATVLAWLFSFNRLPEVFQKLLAVHYSDMTEASGPFDACWLCVVAFLQYWSRVTNHDISRHIVTHHMLLQLTVPWNEVHESCAQVRCRFYGCVFDWCHWWPIVWSWLSGLDLKSESHNAVLAAICWQQKDSIAAVRTTEGHF